MTPIFAHAGHWFLGALEAAPVLILGVALTISTMRDKRRKREAGGDQKPGGKA
jgi:hypothetical protein